MTPAHSVHRALLLLFITLALASPAGACSSDDDASSEDSWQLSEPAPQLQPDLPRQPEPEPQLEPEPKPEPDPEPEPFMDDLVGRWTLYDTHPRSGITADIFTLRADGTRELELQYSPAGVVYRCDEGEDAQRCRGGEGRTCKLGDTWRAWRDEQDGLLYLEFLSPCSDGEQRAVVFALSVVDDDGTRAMGYSLKTVRVGDATQGWHLIGFDGTFDSTYVLKRCDGFNVSLCPWE